MCGSTSICLILPHLVLLDSANRKKLIITPGKGLYVVGDPLKVKVRKVSLVTDRFESVLFIFILGDY